MPFKGESKYNGEGASGMGMGYMMHRFQPIPTSILPLSPSGDPHRKGRKGNRCERQL